MLPPRGVQLSKPSLFNFVHRLIFVFFSDILFSSSWYEVVLWLGHNFFFWEGNWSFQIFLWEYIYILGGRRKLWRYASGYQLTHYHVDISFSVTFLHWSAPPDVVLTLDIVTTDFLSSNIVLGFSHFLLTGSRICSSTIFFFYPHLISFKFLSLPFFSRLFPKKIIAANTSKVK